jgi:uncharacterized protein HemX
MMHMLNSIYGEHSVNIEGTFRAHSGNNFGAPVVQVVAVLAVVGLGASVYHFQNHCTSMAQNLSEPQIMLRGRNRDGSTVRTLVAK